MSSASVRIWVRRDAGLGGFVFRFAFGRLRLLQGLQRILRSVSDSWQALAQAAPWSLPALLPLLPHRLLALWPVRKEPWACSETEAKASPRGLLCFLFCGLNGHRLHFLLGLYGELGPQSTLLSFIVELLQSGSAFHWCITS